MQKEVSLDNQNGLEPVRGGRGRRVWAWLKRAGAALRRQLAPSLRRILSPAFIVMLFLSATMWYSIKLSDNTYKAELSFDINVEGHEFSVDCVAEGQGARLMGLRFIQHRKVALRWSELEVSASVENPGWAVIAPYSLQNAISAHNTDLKILSVGPVPEIELWANR